MGVYRKNAPPQTGNNGSVHVNVFVTVTVSLLVRVVSILPKLPLNVDEHGHVYVHENDYDLRRYLERPH